MQISQDQCKKEVPCGTPSHLLTEVGTDEKQKQSVREHKQLHFTSLARVAQSMVSANQR